MLKRHSQLFEGFFVATDLVVISIAWLLSYYIRFHSGLLPVDKGIPDLALYIRMLLFVWFIWASVFRKFGLYRPMRGVHQWRESWGIVKANSLSVVLLLSVTYLFWEKNTEFSRLVFALFWVLATMMTLTARMVTRVILRALRRRGYNLRYVIVVGAGRLAEKVAHRILNNPDFGMELLGLLAHDPAFGRGESEEGGSFYRRSGPEVPRGGSTSGSGYSSGRGQRSSVVGSVLRKSYSAGQLSERTSASVDSLHFDVPSESSWSSSYETARDPRKRRFEPTNPLPDVVPATFHKRGPLGGKGGVLSRRLRRLRLRSLATRRARKFGNEHNPFPTIGTYSDLPALLQRYSIDQVVIALPLEHHPLMHSVIAAIGDSIVDVRVVPDLQQFIQLGSLIEEFDGLPVISLASTPLSGTNRFLKRIIDVLLGTLFLLLSAPLMLVIAGLIKLSSKGPIFFSQTRVGLDGKVFQILKFRTMRIDAEHDGARFAMKDDPRVTRLGGFLRKWSLDELPQLFNVVLGQMSLVGPRPERPVFIEEFRKQVPRYMLRHKVQAGMTGWAQVNGWRGNTCIEKRIEHDLYYIENWSVFMDLKIIALTVILAIREKNAY